MLVSLKSFADKYVGIRAKTIVPVIKRNAINPPHIAIFEMFDHASFLFALKRQYNSLV